jgi:magnesium transporter
MFADEQSIAVNGAHREPTPMMSATRQLVVCHANGHFITTVNPRDISEDALQDVFALKRDLLAARRIVAPERDVLNVLIRREVPIFERTTILYLQDVYDHIVRITDSIDTYRALLSSALDAFLSVQSNRLNQILKVLTIASIILMSGALIAGIYGMNFEFMPELHWTAGYPWALGLMVVITRALIAFFRWRKWL